MNEVFWEIKIKLDIKLLFIFDLRSGYGFIDDFVNDLVENVVIIFFLLDIFNKFLVFNIGYGKFILEIFYEIFEDIEVFDEMMVIVESDDLFDILFFEDIDDNILCGLDLDLDRINIEEFENV